MKPSQVRHFDIVRFPQQNKFGEIVFLQGDVVSIFDRYCRVRYLAGRKTIKYWEGKIESLKPYREKENESNPALPI